MFKSLLLTFGLFASISGTVAFAESSATVAPDDAVLAEVDGFKLSLTDYEHKHPTGLFQARNAFYAAHRKITDQFIDEYLLERQAKKEGLTVDQLLEKHVTNAIPKDPSEEVLRVYYEGVDTKEPYEAVRGQIIQALRERRLAKAKTAYMASLRAESKITIRVGPPRAQANLKDTPILGQPDAPVVMMEFADYECPYCQNIHADVQKVLAEYKGKVTFAFKDFPLPQHGSAQKAAEAARCAGVQGKYWEYHDRLFTNKQLALPQLKEQARALNLDGKAFDQCLDSGSQAPLVRAAFVESQAYGVQGTPSFLINGRFFGTALSYEDFRKIIDEELSRPAMATR